MATLAMTKHNPVVGKHFKLAAFRSSVREVFYIGSPQLRMKMTLFFACISFASAVVYVTAVNSILLNGEVIKKQSGYLKTLERDYLKLKSAVVSRESPAWLEERSRNIGMVEASNIRFIGAEQSVALSR